MRRSILAIISCLLGMLDARSIHAANIKGTILSFGPPGQRWTTITESQNHTAVKICRGRLQSELVQLPGAVVEISGHEKKSRDKEPDCFFVETYTIAEVAAGRPAIIGILSEIAKDTHAIVHESGKQWVLAKIPPGMKDLVKSKVICDLVASNVSNGQATWLVARVFPFPSP